jgi:hypothetical protein
MLNLPREIKALALPGVDGDFMEIVVREDAARHLIREFIAVECQRAGVSFVSR